MKTGHPDACGWAVIPAGGSGSRFSKSQDKLLALIGDKPVLIWTLEALLACEALQGCVLVCSEQNLEAYQALLKQALPGVPVIFCTGGGSRRASVYQGLKAIPVDGPCHFVAVHDAARPFLPQEAFYIAIEKVLSGSSGAILAAPCTDTIKQVKPESQQIQQTLDRAVLWQAQTPQVFSKEALLSVHSQVPQSIEATDDAQLMELAGLGPVEVVPSTSCNLKITHPMDLQWAAFLLASGQVPSQKTLD